MELIKERLCDTCGHPNHLSGCPEGEREESEYTLILRKQKYADESYDNESDL
jgi:hypothetical protein